MGLFNRKRKVLTREHVAMSKRQLDAEVAAALADDVGMAEYELFDSKNRFIGSAVAVGPIEAMRFAKGRAVFARKRSSS